MKFFVITLIATLPLTTLTAEQAGRLLGVASCAAATCHGNVESEQVSQWTFSASTFLAHDPHAGAGLVLRNALSASIVHSIDPDARTCAAKFDQVLRRRCISCHTTSTAEMCASTGLLDGQLLAAGVSCESCHGPAGGWIKPHVSQTWSLDRSEDWSELIDPAANPSENERMRDNESIMGRAVTCVRCHVGSRGNDGLIRDMNHDLIAAGHPALRFDLLIYNENLPSHWDRTASPVVGIESSAIRVRDVDRAVRLAAAATLSAQRAETSQRDATIPYPEFSDYDCFGCHRPIQAESPRVSPLQISLGLPVWNAWHLSPDYLSGPQAMIADRDRLKRLSPHRSDPKKMITGGRALAKIAIDRARKAEDVVPDPREHLVAVANQIQAEQPYGWHHAAYYYLELDAVVRDLTRSGNVDHISHLETMITDLESQLRFHSGGGRETADRFQSPAEFDPKFFQSIVERTVKSLQNRK